KPEVFFPGIPQETVSRIVRTLGRSRDDWRLEGKMAAEMEKLSPRVKKHRYEWDGMALMARTLQLQRAAFDVVLEVDFFTPNIRPTEAQWGRRLQEQTSMLQKLAAMRKQVRAHFGRRSHGQAFEEWLGQIFDLPTLRLKDCQKITRRKMGAAKKLYASR